MKATDLFIKMMAIAGNEYRRIADFSCDIISITEKYEQIRANDSVLYWYVYDTGTYLYSDLDKIRESHHYRKKQFINLYRITLSVDNDFSIENISKTFLQD